MASGSGLCKTTSNFIWGQLLLLGEGIPDPGDIFNTGSSLFKQISDKMGLAIPGTNWIGQAAEAYLNQNIAQQLRAQVMGDLDKLTGNMISNQAKYVSDTRDVLRAMKKMIDGVYKVCKGLEKIPLLGHLWSWELAIPMSGIAMAVVGGALLYLTIMTLMNATNLRGILGRLIEMLTTLPKFPGLPGLPSLPDIIDGLWPPKLPDIPIPACPTSRAYPTSNGRPPPAARCSPTSRRSQGSPGSPPYPVSPGSPGSRSSPPSPGSPHCPGCPAFPTCSPACRVWATCCPA